MILPTSKHAEASADVRPSILPKLSLCLSLSSLVISMAALSIAVNPDGARELALRVAAWASEPTPGPGADVGAAKARMGRRKAQEFARRKALAEALERDRAKAAQPAPQPPQTAGGTAGR